MNKNILKNGLLVGAGAAAMALVLSGKEPPQEVRFSKAKPSMALFNSEKKTGEIDWSKAKCMDIVIAVTRDVTAETLSDDQILEKAEKIKLEREVAEKLKELNPRDPKDRKLIEELLLRGMEIKWINKAGQLVFRNWETKEEIALNLEGEISKEGISIEKTNEEKKSEFDAQIVAIAQMIDKLDVDSTIQDLIDGGFVELPKVLMSVKKIKNKLDSKEDPFPAMCDAAFLTLADVLKSEKFIGEDSESDFESELRRLQKENGPLWKMLEKDLLGSLDMTGVDFAHECAGVVREKYQACTE